jgi:hypothetical protein
MFQVAKVVRLVFIFFFLVVFLFIYAYLPLTIDIGLEEIGRVGRNSFFYTVIGLFVGFYFISHFLQYFVDRQGIGMYQRLFIHLLPAVLYFALTLLVGYIGVNNNSDDIRPSTFYYLNYLCIVVLVGWICGFLFVLVKRK